MRKTFGLSNNQMRLLSRDRRGLEKVNRSQETFRIRKKANLAIEFLTWLAERDYDELPREDYAKMLSPELVRTFIDQVISGHNRIKDASGKKSQDVYGAKLAAECLKICLNKLEHEYGLALESRMSAEDNCRHVNGKGTLRVYSKTFEEKARDLRQWSEVILHEIGAYPVAETTKSKSASD